MRSRKARAVAITQTRDRRNYILMMATMLLVLAFAVGSAMAMGSNRPSTPMPGGTDSHDTRNDRNKDDSDKDKATTSDEYEDAVDLIGDQKYQDAIAKLEAAQKKYPESANVLNYLGYCNRKLGENDKAMDYYRQALAKDPKHRGVHNYLGELFLQMKNVKKAENELSTLALLCPDGCEEATDLKKSIDTYKSKTASADPATATQ